MMTYFKKNTAQLSNSRQSPLLPAHSRIGLCGETGWIRHGLLVHLQFDGSVGLSGTSDIPTRDGLTVSILGIDTFWMRKLALCSNVWKLQNWCYFPGRELERIINHKLYVGRIHQLYSFIVSLSLAGCHVAMLPSGKPKKKRRGLTTVIAALESTWVDFFPCPDSKSHWLADWWPLMRLISPDKRI